MSGRRRITTGRGLAAAIGTVLLRAWLAVAAATAPALAAAGPEFDRLAALAPDLRSEVLARALTALHCASDPQLRQSRILAIIDYSLPSTDRRLWVFDRDAPTLLFHTLVAHGSGSGELHAERFSNRHRSRQSSLGLFRAGEVYQGRNGYSLRLDGLDPGVNDEARARAIVVHGAWYASPGIAARYGRLGRSWGCPVLAPEQARDVIDTLRDGGALFISAEDPPWLAQLADRSCHTPFHPTDAAPSRSR